MNVCVCCGKTVYAESSLSENTNIIYLSQYKDIVFCKECNEVLKNMPILAINQCVAPARLSKKRRIQKKYIKKYGMVYGYRDSNGMFHKLYFRGTSADYYGVKNYKLSLLSN